MIHTCIGREWYVREFLVPTLIERGIPPDDIHVWLDDTGVGNLASCIESFSQCAKHPGETWHLQDDVILCSDFGERTSAAPEGVVCGFCVDKFEEGNTTEGSTIARFMWQSSFPCIKIPNDLAGEFAAWIIDIAQHRDDLRKYYETGKKDDTLFYIFMLENHFDMPVTNMTPHLVDHVDYLIGGSIINQSRKFIARSSRFNEQNLIQDLKEKLASRN